jgi:uncharacterized membrane protein
MEFLKHSSALDLLVILLVVLSTIVLVVVGIALAVSARRRTLVYLFLAISVLPLLLSLVGTYLRFMAIDRALSFAPEASEQIVADAHREAWLTSYVGAACTGLLAVIGVTALLVKKEQKA